MRQELAASISRVSVTSSAADIPSVTVDLAATNGIWGGIIGNIPAGSNRAFLAQAFNASGDKLFEGSASGISITANQTTLVAITLQEVNAPPPFQNEAPLIDSLVASDTTVAPGGSITLQATAHDPNTGDTLSYAWSSTSGSLSAASAAATSWTAPLTTGIQTLTVTVTDPGGLSSNISLAVNVANNGSDGEAEISITFNSSPRVASLSATPTRIAVGQPTAVSVSASDPDGDSLSYAWSATCAGTWTNAAAQSAQFTPSSLPADACNNCQLTVSVSDGHGGQTTGTVALCVGDTPPINHFPPVIVRSYRSSDTASSGQVLTYEVVASDPEDSALSFWWTANSGTLGAEASTDTTSRITWTAPDCTTASTMPVITATVTNAFDLTTTRSFAVTGLPACPEWSSAGAMSAPRKYHTATRLPDGRVLITGGLTQGGDALATAELYDPASGSWSPTSPMATPRWLHTATLLPNGRVLVTGGSTTHGPCVSSAELYDPGSGTWSPTQSSFSASCNDIAMPLPDGRVLVVGGWRGTVDVYDPVSGTWTQGGEDVRDVTDFTATLLPDGTVLVAGGIDWDAGNETAEAMLYDPVSHTWIATTSMPSARRGHSATLLPSGKVLIAGGVVTSGPGGAALYDPASHTWSSVGASPSPHYLPASVLMQNGKLLVVGGESSAAADVFVPASSSWSATNSMAVPREHHTATLLLTGQVLVTGGENGSQVLETAELYTP